MRLKTCSLREYSDLHQWQIMLLGHKYPGSIFFPRHISPSFTSIKAKG